MKSEYERWESKVDKETESGCWHWTGAKYRKGYGHFRRYINGKWVMYKAHRFSFEYFNKTDLLDPEKFVCHTCDNPQCVNPSHLFLGTRQDNVDDCVSKNRHGFGINQEHTRLSTDQIKEIRRLRNLGLTFQQIADTVGTSAPQAHRVATFKTHKNV